MFQSKVACVTGSGRGIGAATAEWLIERGARVVLTSRTESELSQTAKAIESRLGPGARDRIAIKACDVSDEKSVDELFKFTQKKWGPIELLVNNAGYLLPGNLRDVTAEAFDRHMAINVRGVFICTRAFFRQWPQSEKAPRGAAIVNVSSLAGVKGVEKFPGYSSYVTSKFAVTGMTEVYAAEGREVGIRVNGVSPGATDTRMLREGIPKLKPQAQPMDVAKAIGFLLDDSQSAMITGTMIELYTNG